MPLKENSIRQNTACSTPKAKQRRRRKQYRSIEKGITINAEKWASRIRIRFTDNQILLWHHKIVPSVRETEKSIAVIAPTTTVRGDLPAHTAVALEKQIVRHAMGGEKLKRPQEIYRDFSSLRNVPRQITMNRYEYHPAKPLGNGGQI